MSYKSKLIIDTPESEWYRVAGLLSEGQFVDLNQSFLDEKDRLERRLAHIGEELARREDSQQQTGLLGRAQELLKLETVP